MSKPRISIEGWFALGGLILGIAFLYYRSSAGASTVARPVGSRPVPTVPLGDNGSDSSVGEPVTLGTPVTINQATTPTLQSPEADPLLPPTSPQLDAVLALKYYLLSDAKEQAMALFKALPAESRDVVVRSALYAVWERGEQKQGDWFMGATIDPYTSRESALRTGSDPARNIDSADATPTKQRIESEIQLATERIELASKLLSEVDAKTQAYWIPYLVIKLRRLHTDEHHALIDKLVKDGNAAIADSLEKYEIELKAQHKWSFATQTFNVVFPLILSALGFVMAKISQSTLAAIDRWIGKYWLKVEKSDDKAANETK